MKLRAGYKIMCMRPSGNSEIRYANGQKRYLAGLSFWYCGEGLGCRVGNVVKEILNGKVWVNGLPAGIVFADLLLMFYFWCKQSNVSRFILISGVHWGWEEREGACCLLPT